MSDVDAENAPSGSAAWELVQRRIRTRRRNRRFVTSAVVCIAVVAVAAGVLALHRNAAPQIRVEGTPAAYPSRLVAVRSDRRLVVIDSRTGAEIRTLATDVDGSSAPTVTPDGAMVFFVRDAPLAGGQCGPIALPQIWSIPIGGGHATPITPYGVGSYPAVSPDGSRLAMSAIARGPSCSAATDAVLVVDLARVNQLRAGVSVGRGFMSAQGTVDALSWAPDSRHLLVSLNQHSHDVDTLSWVGKLDQAPVIQMPATAAPSFAYLGNAGAFVSTIVSGPPQAVVAIDPVTRRMHSLFSVSCSDAPVLTADRPGTAVLALCFRGLATPELLRWSQGESSATKIGTAVAAAWVPDPAESSTTGTTSATRVVGIEDSIRYAFGHFFDPQLSDDQRLALIQGSGAQRAFILDTFNLHKTEAAGGSIVVDKVTLRSSTTADVSFRAFVNGRVSPANPGELSGTAVLENGTWKISWETFCRLSSHDGAPCPAR